MTNFLDGQTIPYAPDLNAIRKGLAEEHTVRFNWALWILIILLLIAAILAILYFCYKCQQKRSKQRVGSADDNNRLTHTSTQLSAATGNEHTNVRYVQQISHRSSQPIENYPMNEGLSPTDRRRAAEHVNRYYFERLNLQTF